MTAAPAAELAADWLPLDTADGTMLAYRVRPATSNSGTPPAAVILLQEAFGVNDHIQDVARRFAAHGYLVVAPELFHGSGVHVVPYTDHDAAIALIGQIGPEPIVTDVGAVVCYLGDTEHIAPEHIAVVGFCFGGRAAFTAAAALPLAAAVVFYGPGIVRGPHAVLDQTGNITGRVLMFAGSEDPRIPADDIAAIRAAAQHHNVDLTVTVFPGAGHAFHCDARPTHYVADAATQAWRATIDFLAATLHGADDDHQ